MKTIEENMSKASFFEQPFEKLPHQSDDMVRNWYKARAFVLNLLNSILQTEETLPQCWHFVVEDDSDLMLSVVRHLALYAHFVSFEEYNACGRLSCKNRTIITIVSKHRAEAIEANLKKSEYLCKFPEYCKISLFGKVLNADSYLDIELDIVDQYEGIQENCSTCKKIEIITRERVQKSIESMTEEELFWIDTRKAIYAGKSYDLGTDIKNLPYEDINCAKRYFNALNTFKTKVLTSNKEIKQLIKLEEATDIYAIKSGISNIFCADCFEIREKEVEHLAQKEGIVK